MAVAPDRVSVWAVASRAAVARAPAVRVPAAARVVAAEVWAALAVPVAVARLMQEICGVRRQGRAAVAAAELAEERREWAGAGLAARAVSAVQEADPEGVQVEAAARAVLAVQEVDPGEVQVAALAGQVAPEVQEEAALGEATAGLPLAVRALEVRKAQRPGNGSPRPHCCARARQRAALVVSRAWAAERAVARIR